MGVIGAVSYACGPLMIVYIMSRCSLLHRLDSYTIALFGAVALVAAFPDVVVQALVLGVPKVGPEVEAHLTEQLGETAVAVLDVLVGSEVHIEGCLDLLHALPAQRLQSLLELGQRIDAGNGEHRCSGEGVDHIGLHGPFCENDSGRRPACEMDPAFGAAAVGLLRTGDPAELPAGDLVSPDLEALDLTVGIADRDQNPALLMDEGPRPRLSPVEARHTGEI